VKPRFWSTTVVSSCAGALHDADSWTSSRSNREMEFRGAPGRVYIRHRSRISPGAIRSDLASASVTTCHPRRGDAATAEQRAAARVAQPEVLRAGAERPQEVQRSEDLPGVAVVQRHQFGTREVDLRKRYGPLLAQLLLVRPLLGLDQAERLVRRALGVDVPVAVRDAGQVDQEPDGERLTVQAVLPAVPDAQLLGESARRLDVARQAARHRRGPFVSLRRRRFIWTASSGQSHLVSGLIQASGYVTHAAHPPGAGCARPGRPGGSAGCGSSC
jgi:hypothetical protein